MQSLSISLNCLLLLLIANGASTAPFTVNVEAPAVRLEGLAMQYTFRQQSGTPSCVLTITKNGQQIHQSTTVVDGAYKPQTITSGDIGSITENFVANANVVCTSGSNTATAVMKTLVYATEVFGSSSLPAEFHQGLTLSDTQSSPTVVRIIGHIGGVTCNVASADTSKATINKSGPFSVSQGSEEITATKVGSSESGIMKATCTSGSPQKTFLVDVPLYFTPSADPWAAASGDPHFQQIVFDKLSSTTKPICYDVTGSSDDYIYIAGYSESDIKIFGQLKDDYYMHRIIIKSPFGNITASTNHITLDNRDVLGWSIGSFESKMFKYEMFTDHILISTLKGFPMNIRIEKSVHSLSEVHLDVSLKLSPFDYKKMTGLLGDVGRKEYGFYTDVQANASDEPDTTTVIIDKSLIRATRVQRVNSHCYLMNIDDIIKPFKITKYIQKDMN